MGRIVNVYNYTILLRIPSEHFSFWFGSWVNKYCMEKQSIGITLCNAGMSEPREGGGGHSAPPPVFDTSNKPIQTRRADFAYQITKSPLDFQTFLRPWLCHKIVIEQQEI